MEEEKKNKDTNGGENLHEQEIKQRKLGGIKTMPFILSNEICDRFAVTGFHANMITYLTQQLNMPLVKASNTLTNFSGTASLTPIIGALIADSFAGRFLTIVFALLIYELGMISITISAVMPQLRPKQCPTQQNCDQASSTQLWVLYISLILTSIGSGGTRPCVVTFAADQFDIHKLRNNQRWNFFNWYYFCLGLASLSALTIVVYIQDRISWGWGLGIPTIAMGLAIMAFLIGSPLYRKLKPEGSPLVRVAQVIVAAVKKRNVVTPDDPELLYHNKELDAKISNDGRLLHTQQLRWLDKAAILTEGDTAPASNSPNLWRISTVHRVEELKSVLRLLPVLSTGIIFVMAYSHQQSFTIMQARTMNRHISSHTSFEIPPASMAIFNVASILISIAFYERVFVPFIRRFTKNPAGITCLQRIGIGFVINVLSTLVAALVEIKRKSVATRHDLLDKPTVTVPVSVFWLVPQYTLHGVAEAFFQVGKLEFLYHQSPESTRSTMLALHWIAIALGQYAGTFMVSMVHKFSEHDGKNWLPDRNLNRGRLEYYYLLVSGIQVLNLGYYLLCAWFYTYKPLEVVKDEEDLELATNGDNKIDETKRGSRTV